MSIENKREQEFWNTKKESKLEHIRGEALQFEVDLSGLIGLAQRAVAEVKYMSPREINELRYRIPEVKKQLERRIRRMENFCANSEEVDRLKKIVEVAQGWQLKLEQLIFGHQS